jgi:hypothetical protein
MRKFFFSVLLVLGGAAVFVFGSPYYTVFPTNGNQAYSIALTACFLIISVALKKSRSLTLLASRIFPLHRIGRIAVPEHRNPEPPTRHYGIFAVPGHG